MGGWQSLHIRKIHTFVSVADHNKYEWHGKILTFQFSSHFKVANTWHCDTSNGMRGNKYVNGTKSARLEDNKARLHLSDFKCVSYYSRRVIITGLAWLFKRSRVLTILLMIQSRGQEDSDLRLLMLEKGDSSRVRNCIGLCYVWENVLECGQGRNYQRRKPIFIGASDYDVMWITTNIWKALWGEWWKR